MWRWLLRGSISGYGGHRPFMTSGSAGVKRTNTRREDDRADGLATFKITMGLCRLL